MKIPAGKYRLKIGSIPAGTFEIPEQEFEMEKRMTALIEFTAEIADSSEYPIAVGIECLESDN